MLNALFPTQADNTYAGHTAALWLLGILIALKALVSVGSIFNGHTAATSADGIPLDTYPEAAARTILALFALVGIARLIASIVAAVVLVRYRSLVPLMFVLFLLEQLGRQVVLWALPVARTGGTSGVVINGALLAMMVVGLGLSLWKRVA